MAFELTTCPYCSSGCGLLVEVKGGRLVGTHPSAAHPVARGSLCIRGWHCTNAPYHRDRVTRPMVRQGQGLVTVTWEEAVAEIARRLSTIAPEAVRSLSSALEPGSHPKRHREHLPPILFSVGPGLANEDALAVKRLANCLGAPVCASDLSGVPVARRALKRVFGTGRLCQSLDSLAGSDLVWIFGADVDTFPQVASRLVAASRTGARVLQFDVYRSPSLERDTTALAIPPDQFALVPLLLQQAAFRLDRIPSSVKEAPGFSRLAAYWLARRAATLPEHAWLPDQKATELVGALAEARSPAVIIGERWLSSVSGERQTVELLQTLALLGVQERIIIAAGEANSWGVCDLLSNGESDLAPLLELFDPHGGSRLSAVFVVGDDLVRRAPRRSALAEKLSHIDTVVVIDRFQTDTLSFAHVVLPSCAFGELDGTLTNGFGTVQRWRRAVPPAGESCPERVWVARIGRALGVDDWPTTPERWLEAAETECTAYRCATLRGLYAEQAPFGIALSETVRLAFAEPTVGDPLPSSPEFPMRLFFGAHCASWSTGVLSQREDLLSREKVTATLLVSPGDLTGAALRAGWPAKVLTPHGEVVMTAVEDKRLPPGVLIVVPVAGDHSASLRAFHPDPDRHSLGIQPVLARLEKA